MRKYKRWNFDISHICFVRLNMIWFLKILKSYQMAVKNRGVLAAIKLGHTRIFINIKKNTWYKTCFKYVGFRTFTGRWRHLVTRRDNQKNTYVKFNSKDHLSKTIPWKLRRVVVSIDNMLLSNWIDRVWHTK